MTGSETGAWTEAISAAELAEKGKAVVSVNDIPEMREAFSGLRMETVDIRYTVGGSQGAARRELVILNW